MSTDLCIEFCKSKASTDRWHEEVELLREEMAQTKCFSSFAHLNGLPLRVANPMAPQVTRLKSKDNALMLLSRLRSSIACMTAMFLSGRAFECTHTVYLSIHMMGGFIITHTWKFHTFLSYMLYSLTCSQPVIHINTLCSLTHGQPVICINTLALLVIA
jgi:hypothetical protein